MWARFRLGSRGVWKRISLEECADSGPGVSIVRRVLTPGCQKLEEFDHFEAKIADASSGHTSFDTKRVKNNGGHVATTMARAVDAIVLAIVLELASN